MPVATKPKKYTGPLGGESSVEPGKPISPMAPIRAANTAIAGALGIHPDWGNYSAGASGMQHPKGMHVQNGPDVQDPFGPKPPLSGTATRPDYPVFNASNQSPQGSFFGNKLGAGVVPPAPPRPGLAPEAQVQQQASPQQPAPPPSGVQFGPPVPPGGLHTPTLNSLGIAGSSNASPPQSQDGLGPLSKALLAGQRPITNPTGPDINPSPIGRVPSPPNLIGNLGLTAPPPAAQPLGGYAANQAGFDARMKAENPAGLFGGTLPVRGADGRVAFADGPMKDMSQKPQFGKDSGASYRFTSVDGPNGTQYVGNNTPEQQKARELFDSRRGGLAQRQSDYQARQAGERSERSSGVLAAAQARGANRAENVRLKRGQLSFDERLAMQDPQSAALKADANGRLGLAREQGAARIAAQKDTLAAQERMNEANNKTRLGIAQSNAAAKNPVEEKPKPYSDSDYKQMDPKEAAGHMIANGIPPAEVNRRMTAITGVDHNWVQQPNGPGLFTGAKPAQPVVTPPVGSPNRAKMAGGMQLPSKRSVFSKEYEKTQKRLDDPRLVSRSPK